jgi:hypothetical protein
MPGVTDVLHCSMLYYRPAGLLSLFAVSGRVLALMAHGPPLGSVHHRRIGVRREIGNFGLFYVEYITILKLISQLIVVIPVLFSRGCASWSWFA